MGRRILLLLCFTLIYLLPTSTTTAQSPSCKGVSLPNNRQYASCNDLPVLNAYLYWTYHPSNRTVDLAFRVTRISVSSNWVAWALNPTKAGMQEAQALVAHVNSSSGAIWAYATAIPDNYNPTLLPSKISFAVESVSAVASGSSEIVMFATITPPRTTVNQVWQVGPLSSGGTPQAHNPSGPNVQSTGTIDFLTGQATSSGDVAGSRQRKKNVHGVVNAVSWGVLMPLGAIIARYLKVFKTADPAWFYLHVTCQVTAYVIGVAGWGLGLKLGSQSSGIVYHSHRNIGITLFCLATLQVLALLLRPNKEHKYRLYWKIYHQSIGYAVIILSIINIFKGLHILDPEKKWKRIYIGILIVLGTMAVLLEAFTWGVVLKRKKENQEKQSRNHNGYNNGYGYGATTPVV